MFAHDTELMNLPCAGRTRPRKNQKTKRRNNHGRSKASKRDSGGGGTNWKEKQKQRCNMKKAAKKQTVIRRRQIVNRNFETETPVAPECLGNVNTRSNNISHKQIISKRIERNKALVALISGSSRHVDKTKWHEAMVNEMEHGLELLLQGRATPSRHHGQKQQHLNLMAKMLPKSVRRQMYSYVPSFVAPSILLPGIYIGIDVFESFYLGQGFLFYEDFDESRAPWPYRIMVISKTGKVFRTRAHFALPDYNRTTHIDEMEYSKGLVTKKSFNADDAENWDVQGSLLHPNQMSLSWGDDCHAVLDVSVHSTHPSKNKQTALRISFGARDTMMRRSTTITTM